MKRKAMDILFQNDKIMCKYSGEESRLTEGKDISAEVTFKLSFK